MAVRFAASLIVLGLVSQACSSNQADVEPEATPAPSAETSSGPAVATNADQVAMGDKIFHGKMAGGTCAGCHGSQGKGTGVAPNLADAEWIDTDGSLDGIAQVITEGVAKPKKHDSAMPPKGG